MLYSLIALYSVTAILLGLVIARKERREGFLIAGRSRSAFEISASKFAASLGGGWLVSYTAYAYQYGFSMMSLMIGYALGFVVFALWAAPRIRIQADKGAFYTLGDFVAAQLHNIQAGRLTNIALALIYLLWLMVTLVSGTRIVDALSPAITYNAALLIVVGVAFVYSLLAGMRAVIISDILQAFVLFAMLLWLVMTLDISNYKTLIDQETDTLRTGHVFGFLLFGFFSVFPTADRFQLVYAAKDLKSVKRGLLYAIVPILAVVLLLSLIGVHVRTLAPDIVPDDAFPYALTELLPGALIPIGVLLVLATVMSTFDTFLYALSSHIVLSFAPERPRFALRICMTIAVMFLFVFCLIWQDIIEISLVTAALMTVPSLAIIYIIAGGSNKVTYTLCWTFALVSFAFGLIIAGISPVLILFVIAGGFAGLAAGRGYNMIISHR